MDKFFLNKYNNKGQTRGKEKYLIYNFNHSSFLSYFFNKKLNENLSIIMMWIFDKVYLTWGLFKINNLL